MPPQPARVARSPVRVRKAGAEALRSLAPREEPPVDVAAQRALAEEAAAAAAAKALAQAGERVPLFRAVHRTTRKTSTTTRHISYIIIYLYTYRPRNKGKELRSRFREPKGCL